MRGAYKEVEQNQADAAKAQAELAKHMAKNKLRRVSLFKLNREEPEEEEEEELDVLERTVHF